MNNESIIKLGLIILVLIISAVLIIKRFVYFQPTSQFVPTQENYKEVNQGHINGWFLESTSDKVVLFCHGNAGNISHREGKVSSINQLGYSVLIFDYSGYGRSKGIPSEQQCYDDASTMVALLLQKYQPHNIIIYGESLGGPVAVYAARRYRIPTIILDSPLPGIKILIKSKFPTLSFLSFLFSEFDTEAYLNGYKGRSLMLHSKMDEIIPYNSTTSLQRYVTQLISINGTHNNPQIPWVEIKRFIEEIGEE